jgi:hypothetical protein
MFIRIRSGTERETRVRSHIKVKIEVEVEVKKFYIEMLCRPDGEIGKHARFRV